MYSCPASIGFTLSYRFLQVSSHNDLALFLIPLAQPFIFNIRSLKLIRTQFYGKPCKDVNIVIVYGLSIRKLIKNLPKISMLCSGTHKEKYFGGRLRNLYSLLASTWDKAFEGK